MCALVIVLGVFSEGGSGDCCYCRRRSNSNNNIHTM